MTQPDTAWLMTHCLIRYALLLGLMLAPCAARAQSPDLDRQAIVMLEAAGRGDVPVLNRTIIVGGKVDSRDHMRRTPLMRAIDGNHLEAFKLLLAEGADINTQAQDGDTPWLLAGALGRTEMLRLMLPKGPDYSIRNRYGGNALIPACQYGHVETVRLLLTTPINVNHVNNLGWTCLTELILLGDGSKRYQDIARLILAAGADPNLADNKGQRPLSHALTRGQGEITRLLIAAGAR